MKNFYIFLSSFLSMKGSSQHLFDFIVLECLIFKIAIRDAGLSFIQGHWMNFGMGLDRISNSFRNASKQTAAILYYVFIPSSILEFHDCETKILISSEDGWRYSTNIRSRFNSLCKYKEHIISLVFKVAFL